MKMNEWSDKKIWCCVGLMSGTSVDGIDAALTKIDFSEGNPTVSLLAFENLPYPETVKKQIFQLFQRETATVDKVGYMNFLLGELYGEAALSVIRKACLRPEQVDLIGSHGQTIWHEPKADWHDGFPIAYTVQIGEGAVIAARTRIVTVSDFRVADIACKGQGAPLVPFTEYLMYRQQDRTILLQNIGGIGNMTVLPEGCVPGDVFAFDTGPGNMIIDAVISALTGGEVSYDAEGSIAARGKVNQELMAWLKQDSYYRQKLPKTTGRERFGVQYTEKILAWATVHKTSMEDLLATVTDLTAWSIADAYEQYVMPRYRASELIVGGGGSMNLTLMRFLKRRMTAFDVNVKTQEDLGYISDAKEAVAFALLACFCAQDRPNVLPGVTGAKEAAVMGKISLPPFSN